QLKVLALDPDAVDQVFAILQQPDVRRVLEAEAATFGSEFDEEYEGPEFLRDIIRTVAQVDNAQAQTTALLAALDEPAPTPAFRQLLADLNLRSWIGSLSLDSNNAQALNSALAELNQFDVLDPLSKASIATVADVGGAIFSTIFSV